MYEGLYKYIWFDLKRTIWVYVNLSFIWFLFALLFSSAFEMIFVMKNAIEVQYIISVIIWAKKLPNTLVTFDSGLLCLRQWTRQAVRRCPLLDSLGMSNWWGWGPQKKSEFMSVSQVCMPTTIERNSNSVFFVGTNSAIVSFTKPMRKWMAL
jgi:hypothetical protein